MESLSYREVITTNLCQEEWHEITLNTGKQSVLVVNVIQF